MLREKDHEIAWKGPGRGRTSGRELREVHDEGTNHEEKAAHTDAREKIQCVRTSSVMTHGKVRVTGEPSLFP